MKRYAFFILCSFIVVFATNFDSHAASSNTGGSIWSSGVYTPPSQPTSPVYTPPSQPTLPVYTPPSQPTSPVYTPPSQPTSPVYTPPGELPPTEKVSVTCDPPCDLTKDYCGSKKFLWSDRWVPEYPPWTEDKTLFKRACYDHDNCYSNCSYTKQTCDQEFYKNTVRACLTRYNNDPLQLDVCLIWAKAYYEGVDHGAAIPYLACKIPREIGEFLNDIKAFATGNIPTIFDVAHSAAQYLPDGSTIALSGSVGVGVNIGKAGGAGIDLVSQGVSITHAKDGKTIIEFPLDIGPEGSLDFIVGVSGGAQLNSTGYIEISADGQTYALGRKIGAHTDAGISLSTPTPVISGGIEGSLQTYAYEKFQITMPKSKWEELPFLERIELLREVRSPDGAVTMVAHGAILDAFNSDIATDWSFESGQTKYAGVFISAGGGAGFQGEVTASFGYETEV